MYFYKKNENDNTVLKTGLRGMYLLLYAQKNLSTKQYVYCEESLYDSLYVGLYD